jgi:hypothetical protein
MKSGFKDPDAIKNQKPKDTNMDKKNPIWDFSCPQYDERTSCYIKAGTDYGVGHKQPVGRQGNPKMHVDTLPFGKVKTMKTDET